MFLLGNIELMELENNTPKKITDHLVKIKEAGHRISGIVKKIQTISSDKVKAHDSRYMIIDINQ